MIRLQIDPAYWWGSHDIGQHIWTGHGVVTGHKYGLLPHDLVLHSNSSTSEQ